MARPRRSSLAVPGSSPKMIDKARSLPVDQVFLDLEDACAPLAKPEARRTVVAALNEGGFDGKLRVVRVNDWTTHWTYRDVVDVVEGAGSNLDCVMLPKVQSAEQVVALDLLLTQIETTMGYEVGRIGIEAQTKFALVLADHPVERAEGEFGIVFVERLEIGDVHAVFFGPGDAHAVEHVQEFFSKDDI